MHVWMEGGSCAAVRSTPRTASRIRSGRVWGCRSPSQPTQRQRQCGAASARRRRCTGTYILIFMYMCVYMYTYVYTYMCMYVDAHV